MDRHRASYKTAAYFKNLATFVGISHGTYISWQLRNSCARVKGSRLSELFKAFL